MTDDNQAYTWRKDIYFLNTMVDGKDWKRKERMISKFRFIVTKFFYPDKYKLYGEAKNVLYQKERENVDD